MTTPPGSDDLDITDGACHSQESPQQDLFSAAASSNFGHFNDPEITKDLNDIDSNQAEDSIIS